MTQRWQIIDLNVNKASETLAGNISEYILDFQVKMNIVNLKKEIITWITDRFYHIKKKVSIKSSAN